MAATDIVTPSRETFLVGDVSYKRAVSESLLTKFAAASNFIMDKIYVQEQFAMNGFFNANNYDNGVSGIRYVENSVNIDQYYLSIRSTGASGTNAFNIAMYNNLGVSVGNLFSSPVSLSGSNGTNVLIGRKDIQGTPTIFDINKGVHGVDYGTLSITTIPAGYMLVPFIVSNAQNAFNLFFSMKLKEQ